MKMRYNETKEKICLRRELYKKVISGREELWDEYCGCVKR